jgi:hypothetical protein
MKSQLFKKPALWIGSLGLLGGIAAYAHDPYQNRNNDYGYGYYDYDGDLRHHQRDEKRALRQHEEEELYQYGDSWALREHQREERRELQRHQRGERFQFWNGWDRNGFYDRGGYYYSRPY